MAILMSVLMLCPAALEAYTVEEGNGETTGQLAISPTKVELDARPGETLSRDVKVANQTGDTVTIMFSVEDFEGSSDPSQATVFMGDEVSDWGARDWLDPEVTSIVLQQGETITFRVRVTVPRNAEAGGRYAALFASPTTETVVDEESTSGESGRVSCLFLVRVSGYVFEAGNLDELKVPSLLEYGPVDFGIIFNNESNVHQKPSGRVTVTNLLGRTVEDLPVTEWVVLAESSRMTNVQWDSRYLFGRYTATAEISYGTTGETLVASKSFWVIPWKLLLGAVAVIVVLIILISMSVRKKRRGQGGQQGGLSGKQPVAAEKPAAAAEGKVTEEKPSGEVQKSQPDRAALSELFPSMDDDRVVDLTDPDTIKLIRSLINNGVDLARTFIDKGEADAARRELEEARGAARRLGLLSEVGLIDNMLRSL